MQDPERLWDADSEADPLEREVLSHLRGAHAPAHVKSAAWQGIAAGIAVAAVPATTSSAAAAASASVTSGAGAKAALGAGAKLALGASVKVALVAAISAAAVGGAYVAYRHEAGARMPVLHVAPARARVALPAHHASPIPAAAEVVPAAPIEVATPAASEPVLTPRAAASHAPSKTKSNDLLAEESALLGTARAQLRNGDAGAAEATLDHLRQRVPKGALRQEREVLRIDVLVARGDHDAAMHAARAFVRRYPNSPHSTQLRSFLNAP